MATANINRFVLHLQKAFDVLGAQVPMNQIEHMAVLVHSAMESPRRRYHVSDHPLSMCEDLAPRQVLAAVFHDVVYYQLDDGFAPPLAALLTPMISQHGRDLIVLQPAPGDTGLQLCLDLFGFWPGQVLPLFAGMNEFLSATVAVRLLQPWLQPVDLMAVVACIEATIPFRAPQADGRDCTQLLAERVRAHAGKLLGVTDGPALEDCVLATLRDAVATANRDVDSFAEPDPAKFVATTWLLIEESNAPLSVIGVYTLQDYREALSRMQRFLDGLMASRVFHHFAGVPDAQAFERMTQTAGSNIRFASSFLRLKIISITLMEALALETGGNGPVSMFLGDIHSSYGQPERIEDYLPTTDNRNDLDPQLLQMLDQSRAANTRHDLTMSPLSAFVYRKLGPAGSSAAWTQARRMVNGEVTPREFLAGLPSDVLGAVISACARIAVSRRERLLALQAELLVR